MNSEPIIRSPPVFIHSFQVRHAFVVMDLVAEQITDVLSVLSAILHIGNISFKSAAGAQIADRGGL